MGKYETYEQILQKFKDKSLEKRMEEITQEIKKPLENKNMPLIAEIALKSLKIESLAIYKTYSALAHCFAGLCELSQYNPLLQYNLSVPLK